MYSPYSGKKKIFGFEFCLQPKSYSSFYLNPFNSRCSGRLGDWPVGLAEGDQPGFEW
jgi:hypothetical protein